MAEAGSLEDASTTNTSLIAEGASGGVSTSRSYYYKLLMEIETNALKSQQEIGLVRSQMAAKQREKRLAQLTSSEITSLAPETPIYEGVGKMFVAVPVPDMKNKLESQMKQVDVDIEGLGKKLHYLETTAKNSQEHIEAMLKRGAAGAS
ncbi:hypothetical protein VP1G_10264 [Cytospora mali]|uniref:Prefoldin subunit 1 n=1 Tax=Cytospora mali TaxID=578113 RepID=A0A194VGZ6_CYTMA|nr:hypothetical protein VP1G_10264 [Valsa mali var. pyri (nom. inval.)]